MIPSSTLILRDRHHAPFGRIRLSPKTADADKGDCIFDVSPTEDQAKLPEVRWLAKRDFTKCGEHGFVLEGRGTLTVSAAGFRVVFILHDEHEFRSAPPMPLVWANWEDDSTV